MKTFYKSIRLKESKQLTFAEIVSGSIEHLLSHGYDPKEEDFRDCVVSEIENNWTNQITFPEDMKKYNELVSEIYSEVSRQLNNKYNIFESKAGKISAADLDEKEFDILLDLFYDTTFEFTWDDWKNNRAKIRAEVLKRSQEEFADVKDIEDAYDEWAKINDQFVVERDFKKEVAESLLKEGHDVQEYKGFELDLDTDLTNHDWEDEEYVITPTVEIKYNGKVLATANGYRAARAWVDKHAKVVPYTPQEKIKQLLNILDDDYTELVGDNTLVFYDAPVGVVVNMIIHIKSLDEIYYTAELMSMDDFLNYSDVTKEELLKAFPRLDENSWNIAVELTLDHLSNGNFSSPLLYKANSIKELLDNLSDYGVFYNLSDEDYQNLVKEEKITVDGKVIN